MAKRKRRKQMTVAVPAIERIRNSVLERQRLGHGTATVERLMQAGHDGHELTPPTRATPAGVQRIIEAPLDRQWKTGAISQREFEAGDKLRALAYLAAIDPAGCGVDWNAAGGGGRSGKVPAMFTSQHIADARIDYRRVERAISGIVWRVLNLALIRETSLADLGQSVFGRQDRREAAVAGAAAFQVALGSLADWFGT